MNMCERTYNLVGFPTASEVSEGDQRLFAIEAKMFEDLCVGLSQPCVCSGRWKLHSTKQVGYCYDDQE